MIIKNRIRCKLCNDIIESTYTHDFKWCSCKSVAVDGGHLYLRRCGDAANWEDLSIVENSMMSTDAICSESVVSTIDRGSNMPIQDRD